MRRLLVCALVLAAGCRDVSHADEVVVEGRLTFGWEVESFRPCGSTENWLPLISRQMYERYDSLTDKVYEPVFARFRGTVGPPGRYGMMGGNDHEFRVVEALEMRKTTERDCPNTR
jgi:hypothetical protein